MVEELVIYQLFYFLGGKMEYKKASSLPLD